ncbi:lipopolysaccharide biosynthesis protein RfbH [Candidatus Roizmanbacteria bacterium RIFCSPLOWO2_01_FULL_38_12]|uniref:Lipopolysaccharide biosynthesis protein RfbH n=1 Tax=Candidatus Roizmanbacteria bacterium RIFCSPLOWO2_01_FULL_38_12 TaxID=1802061 RepID=A0A1F7IUJ9_9BACT|nr:MAG: lipopolysaccharide biosynthesis protein RfbH [Candidatus Roizmanbacteria bacterium RIFCSPHIGHO2_01_FULL_38_15]OGK34329.1 MAG: lipopolysaccharide biosynthesis protein RfbH [Candidatus Roizmanbacteria bacterium RIFCSPHIGHO2_12_FULL_38_13]OGK47029.1 MAG: lipopolysaccharide biosynthesis protein RfbH [Candidatus Roizmanbacteria bacterium RIFCSPLOWO2_01_FULL_38_12]
MIKKTKFIPGESYVPVSGKVYDHGEINNAIEAARDCWWTEGRFTKDFESQFKKFMGVRYVSLVNSGSSANLIALYSLTSKVFGKKALKKGDEFITAAVGFPTTVNPGIQFGLTPVFIDVDLKTLNMDVNQLEKSISRKTKLIMMAHTLGIPYDLEKVLYLVKKHDLWLIEDSCDGLGSKYDGKLVGTFGHIATYSFYPAHMITMGEGGAIITNNPYIHRSIRQFRDWGRDCWCDTGKDNTCGKRFGWKLGELPEGYDHKYIYSQIGFNVKLTDFQAAIGLAQLKKVQKFIEKRKENYKKLYSFFSRYPKYFSLIELSKKEDPCWFGFPLIVKKEAPFSRNELTEYLEKHHVGTRNVFAGNLLRHPAYLNLKKKRVIGDLKNADVIMNQAFWMGVFPGIESEQMRYVLTTLKNFLSNYS